MNKAEKEYHRLESLAQNVEKEQALALGEVSPLYLWDMCIDCENVAPLNEKDGEEFWKEMARHGKAAFIMRCEEYDLSASDLCPADYSTKY